MRALLLLLLWSSSATAVQIGYGSGEQSFQSDRERISACTIAENKALKDAILKFADRQYTLTEESRCVDTKEHAYCDYVKDIDASASGSIKSVVDRIRQVKNNTCYVELQVEIVPVNFITAEVETTRIYYPGELIDVRVKVGQPVYLHIFNLHSNGVDILFPNRYNSNSLIDDRFVYPGQNATVEAVLHGDKTVSRETLLFLFTKRRQDFNPRFVTKESLEKILRSIPVTEKKLIQQQIVIKRSNR